MTGPSAEPGVGAAVVVDLPKAEVVELNNCWCQSIGFVEEVIQSSAVMAYGALLTLAVL